MGVSTFPLLLISPAVDQECAPLCNTSLCTGFIGSSHTFLSYPLLLISHRSVVNSRHPCATPLSVAGLLAITPGLSTPRGTQRCTLFQHSEVHNSAHSSTTGSRQGELSTTGSRQEGTVNTRAHLSHPEGVTSPFHTPIGVKPLPFTHREARMGLFHTRGTLVGIIQRGP